MENSPEQSDHVSSADSEPAEVASPPISPTPTPLPATEGLPAAARFRRRHGAPLSAIACGPRPGRLATFGPGSFHGAY